MARVTVEEVREIITTSMGDAQVSAFIESATLIVDDYATQCTKAGVTVLKEIERQLAAHIISGTGTQGNGQRITSRGFGDSSVSYQQSKTGLDFAGSQYGQTAMMLDPCGVLANMGKPVATARLL